MNELFGDETYAWAVQIVNATHGSRRRICVHACVGTGVVACAGVAVEPHQHDYVRKHTGRASV